jgi:hypothetical protein
MSVKSDKKKRKVITLDTKLDIIKRFDNGQSKASISRALGLNGPRVRLFCPNLMNTKNKVKLHQHLLVYGALGTEVLFWLK